MSEPPFDNWRDQWDYETRKTHDAFEELNLEELLQKVREGQIDFFFTIWDVIPQKCLSREDREKALDTLWKFLRDHPGEGAELHRYHCAGALFAILRDDPKEELSELRKAVQWDHVGENARQQALEKLYMEIQKPFDR